MREFDTGGGEQARFSRDEVMAVVRRAIENESIGEGRTDYDLADLVDIGAQCGVREDQILASLHELRSETGVAEGLERARRAKLRTWYNHAFTFAVINAALTLGGALTGSLESTLVVTGCWSILLAFHTRFAWFPSESALHDKLLALEIADQSREETRKRMLGGAAAAEG